MAVGAVSNNVVVANTNQAAPKKFEPKENKAQEFAKDKVSLNVNVSISPKVVQFGKAAVAGNAATVASGVAGVALIGAMSKRAGSGMMGFGSLGVGLFATGAAGTIGSAVGGYVVGKKTDSPYEAFVKGSAVGALSNVIPAALFAQAGIGSGALITLSIGAAAGATAALVSHAKNN